MSSSITKRCLLAAWLCLTLGAASAQTIITPAVPSTLPAPSRPTTVVPLGSVDAALPDAGDAYHQVGFFKSEHLDSDGDGVPDIDDNCPNTPATLLTRAGVKPTIVDICGCPLDPCLQDEDHDGVGDCDDQCPHTAKGLVVDEKGCPRRQKKPQQFRLDVKFQFAQANLQDQYVPDLDKLKALLVRLPDLKVTLEGHTDFIGSPGYNQSLSQVRAEKCRRYLLGDSRIAPERVRAIGYGKSRPIADNKTDEGRAQNRRTVAVLDYQYEFTPPNDGENLPP